MANLAKPCRADLVIRLLSGVRVAQRVGSSSLGGQWQRIFSSPPTVK